MVNDNGKEAYRIPLQWPLSLTGFNFVANIAMFGISCFGLYGLAEHSAKKTYIYSILSGGLGVAFFFLFVTAQVQYDLMVVSFPEGHQCYAHGDNGHNTKTASAVVGSQDCGYHGLRGALALIFISGFALMLSSMVTCYYRCKYGSSADETPSGPRATPQETSTSLSQPSGRQPAVHNNRGSLDNGADFGNFGAEDKYAASQKHQVAQEDIRPTTTPAAVCEAPRGDTAPVYEAPQPTPFDSVSSRPADNGSDFGASGKPGDNGSDFGAGANRGFGY